MAGAESVWRLENNSGGKRKEVTLDNFTHSWNNERPCDLGAKSLSENIRVKDVFKMMSGKPI